MFTHILCPIDGSEGSIQALTTAANLAAEQNAELTICTVVDPAKAAAMAFGDPAMSAACYDALDGEARAMVEEAASKFQPTVKSKCVTIDGQPVDSIVSYATRNACDLIVMGSHGRGGLSRALLGSVAEGVVRHASIPVMIIRWTGRVAATQNARPAASAAPAS